MMQFLGILSTALSVGACGMLVREVIRSQKS